ncbi:MAG: tRNA (N6-threonylcarbamoyladenosine(37)-N6)-methyltransferase TrmO [Candidatus Odinarchaeota archaeon]
MKQICYQAIGVIHSPFHVPKGTPIQSSAAKDVEGVVEVYPEYQQGLQDVDGFSHLILLYHFHLAKPGRLLAKPYMDTRPRGIFAIRGPSRPNPIGLSIVRLIKVEQNQLIVRDVDIIDGTPLLDIKPYVPEFDTRPANRIGWLEEHVRKLPESRDDGRFANGVKRKLHRQGFD